MLKVQLGHVANRLVRSPSSPTHDGLDSDSLGRHVGYWMRLSWLFGCRIGLNEIDVESVHQPC